MTSELNPTPAVFFTGCHSAIVPVSKPTAYVSFLLWIMSVVTLIVKQCSMCGYYKRIRVQILRHSNRDSTLSDRVSEDRSDKLQKKPSKSEKNLLLVKMKSDFKTIFIISVVYLIGSLLQGFMMLFTTFWKQHFDASKNDKNFIIVSTDIQIALMTFASVFLCYKVYPINSAMRFALNRLLACRSIVRLRSLIENRVPPDEIQHVDENC